MKSDWEVKTLGEVIQKTETINPGQKPDKEFIYIDVSSVDNESFSVTNVTNLKGKDAPSRARKLVKVNDVIFATVRPTLKRIAVIPNEYDGQVCSTGYFVLRAKSLINYRFIFYYLQSEEFNAEMQKLQKGASYPAVTDGEVKDQIISFPKSLAEQQRIVAILDEAFAAIDRAKANAETNLKNARALFESYLQSVFANPGEGWEEKRIGEVCATQYGLSESMNSEAKGFKIFRMGEVQNGLLNDTGSMKYANISKTEFEKYRLNDGDILFNRTNSFELVGKTGIFKLHGEYCFASYLIRLKYDSKRINPWFLNHLMNSSNFQQEIKKKAAKSVSQANINATILSNEVINVPPLAEQQAIVAKLDALSAETKKLEAIYRQKIADLDELKKAILQKAFRGELTKTQGELTSP